jgi:phosphohistidine phosphatase SixA
MHLLLINHAERRRDPDRSKDVSLDKQQPLTLKGEEQVRMLANKLRTERLVPTLYLTSRNVHARQTAEILSRSLGGDPALQVVEVDALTPHDLTESFDEIIEQATALGNDARTHAIWALVGHTPRLNHLFESLTGRPASNRLAYGQAVCLTANSLDDLAAGTAAGEWPKFVEDEKF